MSKKREMDPLLGELYLAGEIVPAGEYCEINDGRQIVLKTGGFLPASLDGHVACYRRLPRYSLPKLQLQTAVSDRS